MHTKHGLEHKLANNRDIHLNLHLHRRLHCRSTVDFNYDLHCIIIVIIDTVWWLRSRNMSNFMHLTLKRLLFWQIIIIEHKCGKKETVQILRIRLIIASSVMKVKNPQQRFI